MTKWGYDEPRGIIIGRHHCTGQLFYDGQHQGPKFEAETPAELDKLGREKIAEYKAEFGGYPCYLYQDDTKWQIKENR